MRGPLRTLAALLALVALSAYFAESAMGSWCMAEGAVPTADSGAGMHAAWHGGAHHHGSADSSPETDSSDLPSSCPLDMAGAGSSCAGASLPAAVEVVGAAPAVQVGVLPLLDQGLDLLLVTTHFRPPRA